MKQENTLSNSGKDYRFSRVYLLRFSKGQFEPCDIHLNNNNIGRRVIYLSRQLCRSGRLRKVWSTNGKITVKDNRGKANIICEESDLVQFGNEITRD